MGPFSAALTPHDSFEVVGLQLPGLGRISKGGAVVTCRRSRAAQKPGLHVPTTNGSHRRQSARTAPPARPAEGAGAHPGGTARPPCWTAARLVAPRPRSAAAAPRCRPARPCRSPSRRSTRSPRSCTWRPALRGGQARRQAGCAPPVGPALGIEAPAAPPPTCGLLLLVEQQGLQAGQVGLPRRVDLGRAALHEHGDGLQLLRAHRVSPRRRPVTPARPPASPAPTCRDGSRSGSAAPRRRSPRRPPCCHRSVRPAFSGLVPPPFRRTPRPLPASRRHFARCGVRGFPWAVCGDRDGAANGCLPPPSIQSRGGAALRDAAGGLPSCALFRPKRPYDEPQGQPRGERGLTRRVPAPQHSC